MSRFLFVSLPMAGHVNPTIGLGKELAARGHEVAWTGSELMMRPLLGPDATVFPTGSRVLREQGEQGFSALQSLWERFIVPYARFTLPTVDKAVRAFEPDVLLVDQHAPAGALVAHRHGLPWATLAVSAMELTRPYRALPMVEAWTAAHLAALWERAGLPAGELFDVRFSPHLVLASTSAALAGPGPYPGHYALVGPTLAERPSDPGFAWHLLDPDRRLVLVTVGTLAGDLAADFYRRAAAALAPLAGSVQAILIAGAAPAADLPENVLVMPSVPLLELLPRVSAVVCHGGMNTVCETLASGVPLVIAPIRHDQPIVAGQVAAAGAGVRVSFGRATAEQLRAAVTSVLDDDRYRTAAGLIRDSFAAAGGARSAADRVERLALALPPNRPLSTGTNRL